MPAFPVTVSPTAPTTVPATWTQGSVPASLVSSAANATAVIILLLRSPRSAVKVCYWLSLDPFLVTLQNRLGIFYMCAEACAHMFQHIPGVWPVLVAFILSSLGLLESWSA